MGPAEGVRVLSLAVNLPGPVAVAQLRRLGAAVVKIEPPAGDPLARARPQWYELLHRGQTVLRLDLKANDGRKPLDHWLGCHQWLALGVGVDPGADLSKRDR